MMTLAEVRDWLKTQVECPCLVHREDRRQQGAAASASITFRDQDQSIAIGGLANTSTATKSYFNPGPLGEECEH
jgi:hypothetical protein